MGEDYKAFMKEMQIEVSQRRIVKLIDAKNLIKEVIHYDPIEKSKHRTIVNMIDEAIVDELKVQENTINKLTNKIEININHNTNTNTNLSERYLGVVKKIVRGLEGI